MTDSEIIKALECCQTEYCRNCKDCSYRQFKTPYISTVTCDSRLRADALDLINRQKAEIEELRHKMITSCGEMCNDNRFELITRYKQKLIDGTNVETAKDEMVVLDNILFRFWQMGWLDKLEKYEEMATPYKNAIPEYEHSLRAEAVKEFAEQVKMAFYYEFDELIPSIIADKIDNIVKEMVGE